VGKVHVGFGFETLLKGEVQWLKERDMLVELGVGEAFDGGDARLGITDVESRGRHGGR